MTVCLSDSQLHLFLQTQLPVGHIEDCVQGHTPYTVTDAILTYASSNRGWAQEEEGVPMEPSLPAVSYESVDSPAPHLPTLQCEKTLEIKADVEHTHEEDVHDTCDDEGNIGVINRTETGIKEKESEEEYFHKVDVHVNSTPAITETEAGENEMQTNEEDLQEVGASVRHACATGAEEGVIEEREASEGAGLEENGQKKPLFYIGATESAIETDATTEEIVLVVDVHENDTSVTAAAEGAVEGKDTSEERSLNENVQQTGPYVSEPVEGAVSKRDSNEEAVQEAIPNEHVSAFDSRPDQDSEAPVVTPSNSHEEDDANEEVQKSSCRKPETHSSSSGEIEGNNEEEGVNEERVLKEDEETDATLIRESEASSEDKPTSQEDVHIVDAQEETSGRIRTLESTVGHEDGSEEDAHKLDAPENNTNVTGAVVGPTEDTHEENMHEEDDEAEKSTSITGAVEGPTEDTQEEAHEEDEQETNTSEIQAMEIVVTEKDTSEDFVQETSDHEPNAHEDGCSPDSKSDTLDPDACVTVPDNHEADISEEEVCKANAHDECPVEEAETNEKDDTHEKNTCVTAAMEGTTEDNLKDDVQETNTCDNEACTLDQDSVVLQDSGDIQEEGSSETKEDEFVTKTANASVVGDSETVVLENTQAANADKVSARTNSLVIMADETILHTLDGHEANGHETENQDSAVHETDCHADLNGQLESTA
ncbi:hypothetical protein JZ751_008079 [Albula glossodonta]|uniref:Uncharacterized protein n=1 Tax=Albula glossodonta TaxID=121402 RepID=A0A8T2P1G0_9TELE|nr:hypothetical protein JZ751_008079 [Albula glossodonta]